MGAEPEKIFHEGNEFWYLHDFAMGCGIPFDVAFQVEWLNDEHTRAKLTAPGYGGTPYGCGSIFITEKPMVRRPTTNLVAVIDPVP